MTREVRLLTNPRQSHKELMDLWSNTAKPWSQQGGSAVLTWQTREAHRKEMLRKAFHSLLGEIAGAVWFKDEEGRRYRHTAHAWKLFAKQEFASDPFASSEEWSDDEYQEITTRLSAFAVTELGLDIEV